jgi:hypothetical protein
MPRRTPSASSWPGRCRAATDHRACPRETLAVYQHVALDSDLEQKYQEAMKKVDL